MVFFPNKAKIPIHSSVCLKLAGKDDEDSFQRQVLHKLISLKLFSMQQCQSAKLVQRIAKNMSDDLKKHNQAHLDLVKMRFGKETAVFSRSFSHANQT